MRTNSTDRSSANSRKAKRRSWLASPHTRTSMTGPHSSKNAANISSVIYTDVITSPSSQMLRGILTTARFNPGVYPMLKGRLDATRHRPNGLDDVNMGNVWRRDLDGHSAVKQSWSQRSSELYSADTHVLLDIADVDGSGDVLLEALLGDGSAPATAAALSPSPRACNPKQLAQRSACAARVANGGNRERAPRGLLYAGWQFAICTDT